MAEAYNFFPTANELITSALEVLRVTDPEANGTIATSNQYTRAIQALNFMLTSWQVHGLQLWARKSASFSLTQGQTSYSVGSGGDVNINRPLKIYSAWRRETSTNKDTPIQILSQKEYDLLNNKSDEGVPIAIYYDPRYESGGVQEGATAKGLLYVYQPANSNSASTLTIHFRYQRPFNDFNALTDELDFPQEWNEAIKWGLAQRLAFVYGAPMLEYDRIKDMAKTTLNEVLGFDTEDQSISIHPRYS